MRRDGRVLARPARRHLGEQTEAAPRDVVSADDAVEVEHVSQRLVHVERRRQAARVRAQVPPHAWVPAAEPRREDPVHEGQALLQLADERLSYGAEADAVVAIEQQHGVVEGPGVVQTTQEAHVRGVRRRRLVQRFVRQSGNERERQVALLFELDDEVAHPVKHDVRLELVADAVVVSGPQRAVVLHGETEWPQVVVGGPPVEALLHVVEDRYRRRVLCVHRAVAAGREVLPDEGVVVEGSGAVLGPRQLVHVFPGEHRRQIHVRVVGNLVVARHLDRPQRVQQEVTRARHLADEIEPRHRVDAERDHVEILLARMRGSLGRLPVAASLDFRFAQYERVEVGVDHVAALAVAGDANELRSHVDVSRERDDARRVLVQVV